MREPERHRRCPARPASPQGRLRSIVRAAESRRYSTDVAATFVSRRRPWPARRIAGVAARGITESNRHPPFPSRQLAVGPNCTSVADAARKIRQQAVGLGKDDRLWQFPRWFGPSRSSLTPRHSNGVGAIFAWCRRPWPARWFRAARPRSTCRASPAGSGRCRARSRSRARGLRVLWG